MLRRFFGLFHRGNALWLLFFFLAAGYYGDMVGPAHVHKWVVLAAVVPIFFWTTNSGIGFGAFFGFLFILWSATSIFWSVSPIDGALGAWRLLIAAAFFHVGVCLDEKYFYKAFSGHVWGVICNAAIALAQTIGWEGAFQLVRGAYRMFGGDDIPFTVAGESLSDAIAWHPQALNGAAATGLLVNANYLGAALALAIVGLARLGKWPLAWPLMAVIPLTQSKAACIGLVVAWTWTWLTARTWRCLVAPFIPVVCIAAIWGLISWHGGVESVRYGLRWALWQNALASIDWTGFGIGNFQSAYALIHDLAMPSPEGLYSFQIRPQNAHSDLLTIAAETGKVGLILVLVFIGSVITNHCQERSQRIAKTIFVAFLGIGLVDFPFETPMGMALPMLCAGYSYGPCAPLKIVVRTWNVPARASFFAVGVLIAYLSFRAETIFPLVLNDVKDGRHVQAFLQSYKAESLWPGAFYVREAYGSLNGVANFLPPEVTLQAIDEVLKFDPHNVVLLWYRIIQELRRGNLKAADAIIPKLERLGAGMEQVQNARLMRAAVEKAMRDAGALK